MVVIIIVVVIIIMIIITIHIPYFTTVNWFSKNYGSSLTKHFLFTVLPKTF
jgi:hypothetical protein